MHGLRILEFLKKNGKSEIETIAKNIRVPEIFVKKEIERLKEKEFVIVEGDKVKISEKGIEELLKYVKRV